MYSPNDFNFGIGSPSLTGSDPSTFGVTIPNYGASNPTASYLQSPAQSGAGPSGWGDGKSPGAGMGGLGLNIDTAKLALGGLQTIGSLWQAYESNKMAKDQFNFQKSFANTNLANQIQSYNTQVDNVGRTRAQAEAQTPQEAAAWLAGNKLQNRTIS